MSEVYAVLYHSPYEGYEVKSVHETYLGAQCWIQSHYSDELSGRDDPGYYDLGYDYITINSYEVLK